MNIRRLVLDVDKARMRPSLLDIAQAIERSAGVEALNITVSEIDIETVGMDITVEGESLDYDEIREAIESTGAVVHSIDQLVSGKRVLERVPRVR
jgi:hypothetical protein